MYNTNTEKKETPPERVKHNLWDHRCT